MGEKEFTFEVDPAAQAFLPPPVGLNVVARRLVGDGNCFFRGMSARQFGTQVLHLHVRLYVVGQLFLERGMYTSGAKGYDYNSFDQVALNEACSVVEFWGVNNPSESRILMHLAELYCVSEPRVFCSPLVCQGCSNSLSMDIQIRPGAGPFFSGPGPGPAMDPLQAWYACPVQYRNPHCNDAGFRVYNCEARHA